MWWWAGNSERRTAQEVGMKSPRDFCRGVAVGTNFAAFVVAVGLMVSSWPDLDIWLASLALLYLVIAALVAMDLRKGNVPQ